MVHKLTLPPSLKVEWAIDWEGNGFESNCKHCKNLDWCKTPTGKPKHYLLLLTIHDYHPSMLGFTYPVTPCTRSIYDKDKIFIGVCYSRCKGELNCSYCYKAYCEKHRNYYNPNKVFKNNGVCCKCLEEFREENHMQKDEPVYMVKRVQEDLR